MRLLFDIEANSLVNEDLTELHCLVVEDLETGERLSCTDNSRRFAPIQEGLDRLAEADKVYGHNIISYDVPALKILRDFELKEGTELIDTLILAQARFPHIRDIDFRLNRQGRLPGHLVGRHSLEAWGWRLGVKKVQYDEGFETWSPRMQSYCEGDLATNLALIKHLRKHKIPKLTAEIELKLRYFLIEQERNGWPLDWEKVLDLSSTLADEKERLTQLLIEQYGNWYVATGEVNPKRTQNRKDGLRVEGCPYTKIKLVEFNPGSRDHLAKILQEKHGWTPEVLTDTGKPKVDETVLKGLMGELGDDAKNLIDYLKHAKLFGQVSGGKKSWVHNSTLESAPAKLFGMPFVHHRCEQNKARTHRAAHMDPNVAQVPKVGKFYGRESRECWTVPPGYVMVGADVSSLELLMMGHYMAQWDGGEYWRTVLEGDPHTLTQLALGIEGELARDCSKTFFYATIYGAGDEKLGKIMVKYGFVTGATSSAKLKKTGSHYREKLYTGLTAFGQLNAWVGAQFREKGYVLLLDGRRAYPSAEHAAINTLFQGSGAIVCKLWIVRYAEKLCAEFGQPGWKHGVWSPLGWIHDETQTATRPENADRFGGLLIESITEAGEELGVAPPLTGEFKVGANWAETH